MNTRVLELLKNPKNIQSEDLDLLKNEIISFPYIQNIRALHLYGVHLYDKENYQKTLSTTAAYTTDKKILYQLINGKIQQSKPEPVGKQQETAIEKPFEPVQEEAKNDIEESYYKPAGEQPEIIAEKTTEPVEEEPENIGEEPPISNHQFSSEHDYEAAALEASQSLKPNIKHIVVDGERNRILFAGEENFLNEDHNETIDLESTLESGVIVTHKPSKSESEKPTADPETNFVVETSEESIQTENKETAETVLNPERMMSEEIYSHQEKENTDASESSFHEIQPLISETEVQTEEIQEESDHKKEIIPALNSEMMIEEGKIDSEKAVEEINTDSELSFHATDTFLPEVKIEARAEAAVQFEAPKSNINKHEEEMRRLIEEVEKKMKAKKEKAEEKKEVQEEVINHDISFAETQTFDVEKQGKNGENLSETTEKESENKQNAEKPEIIENKEGSAETETQPEVKSSWKPMSFESNIPDSFKSDEISTPTIEAQKQGIIIPEEEKSETSREITTDDSLPVKELSENEGTEMIDNDEVPVMNVSFFGSNIASLGSSFKSDQKEKAEEKKNQENTSQPIIVDSNVPGFINTWQNWLKIDRTEASSKDKTEIKNKVIESFIENNPKISQLKDEVKFIVKEKADDISHLMTETLANLYIEQKLYSKAVNAFLVLANKYPDRKEYFEEKIKEINDDRNKN